MLKWIKVVMLDKRSLLGELLALSHQVPLEPIRLLLSSSIPQKPAAHIVQSTSSHNRSSLYLAAQFYKCQTH